jgi:biotin synthase-related radical SAM superfamily protein
MSTEQLTPTPEARSLPANLGAKHLTHAQLGIVLALHREGKTQAQIAQALEVSQQTISRALDRLGTDTTELAVHAAKASAYRAVRRLDTVVKKGSDDHAIRASGKLLEVAEVLNAGNKGVSVGVQVIIGDGPDPLAGAKVINVCTTGGAK